MAAHFRREFARVFGTALSGQQPVDAFLAELLSGLVNGRPRQAELPGGVKDGAALDFDRPDRLVFELHQIVRVEEGMVAKEGGGAPCRRAG